MYKQISKVEFPEYQGNINVNMMPFIMGDKNSLPEFLHGYMPIINKCSKIENGKLAYITVTESEIVAGTSQRRPGIHTEGTSNGGWGGGHWGKNGVYMASTDGSCKVWNSTVLADQVNEHGSLLMAPMGLSEIMEANSLYWLTDRTPHEALPVKQNTKRQFFRLVSEEISVWWKQHSTPNPFGIQPNCKILYHSKF